MKCIACINLWDCQEILPYAVAQWGKCSIDVMILYSNTSNYGQITNNSTFLMRPEYNRCVVVKCEPLETLSPVDNERRKRNYGLSRAREMGYTHYISCDADEFYEPFEMDWEATGTVVECQTYFKSPCLTIGKDTTLISFIHKLTPTLQHQFNRNYPYAFTPGIRIDPSRQYNINSGIIFRSDIVCHHFSYCRQDIGKKVFNSTARPNINMKVLKQDLIFAKDGYYCQYYQRRLYTVENKFNLPEWPGEFLTSSESRSLPESPKTM